MAGKRGVCRLLMRKFRKKKFISVVLLGCLIFIIGNAGKYRRNSTYTRKFKHPNGYVNAVKTQKMCEEMKLDQEEYENTVTVRWNHNKTVLYCPAYKVGTTFWRRVFMINSVKKYENKSTPYDIPFDQDYKSDKYNIKTDSSDAHAQFKFMFSRNPYDRLLSVYIDKLLAPNPYFWKLIGIPAIQLSRPSILAKTHECGHDVTFREFIQYVIHMLENNAYVDPHVQPINRNCQPCRLQYNFIGTMENFRQDSYEILMRLNMNSMAAILNATGSELAAIDAIKDTLSQPFAFRSKYLQCMSLQDAVVRAWRKLMIRGLIGSGEYEINSVLDVAINKYSFNRLVTHALLIRKISSSRMRKKSKCDLKMDFWAEIDDELIAKIQKLYARDFRLFQYSNRTEHLLLYC